MKQRIITILSAVTLCGAPLLVAHGQQSSIQIRQEIKHDLSPAVRDLVSSLPTSARSASVENEEEEKENRPVRRHSTVRSTLTIQSASALQSQSLLTAPVGAVAGLNFDGVPSGTGWAAPDTNGAVGTTQFVQWVNTQFAVYDKTSGAPVLGPVLGNTLWSGFGGVCETNNNGDVIAQFDKIARRWVMTQHAAQSGGPYFQCVAVSTTSDATGTFYRYAFQLTTLFPDYPKLAVWPDAYYVSINLQTSTFGNGGATVCALDRNAMLSGAAASSICFSTTSSHISLLPSDLDGSILPPTGSPNYLLDLGTNSLNMWKFHVDFQTPANSSFTGPTSISVIPFTQACSGGQCIPQSGTTEVLDSLGDRLMYRLAYRHFNDGHESLVVTHSVGSPAGIRWYEIQNPGGTPVVFQQGTFSPDSTWRWMGSIAMDYVGDIAVGYSESSSSMNPAIYYTGRVPTDPLGTMEGENLIFQGTGSESASYRWGDYSSMSVDPMDDCTFWYTNEYVAPSGSWNTRIASFKFPACSNAPPPVTLSPTSLIFTGQLVGTTSAGQVATLTNDQSVPLNISGISISSNFAQTNTCSSSVAAGGSCTITVTFTPNTTGVLSGSVSISDDAGNSPQVLMLSGTGIAPAVTFSRTSLTLGSQAVGTSSASKSTTLTNSGSAPLSISGVSISGGFTEVDSCTGAVVQPTGTCTINVSFGPSLAGTATGEVTIADTAGSSPQLVSLSGTAFNPLTFSPTSLSFGSVNVGTTTTSRTVTVSNNLRTTVLNLNIVASGNYSVAGNGSVPCGSTLAAASKCTVGITFTPTANANIRGAVTISYNGLLSPQVVTLSGFGVNGTLSAPLTFSPLSLLFNGVVGGVGVAKTVKVTNSGTVAVDISSISASGNFFTSSTSSLPCGGLLAVAATCTFTVNFAPTVPGATVGAVTIADDSAVSPQILDISGTGILPVTLSPASLTFTTQTVGTTSPSQTITVSNNQSTAVTINRVAASGDYLITQAGTKPCGSSVPALSSCTFGVAFDPTVTGTIAGTATINYNAAFSPQEVSVTGTGQ